MFIKSIICICTFSHQIWTPKVWHILTIWVPNFSNLCDTTMGEWQLYTVYRAVSRMPKATQLAWAVRTGSRAFVGDASLAERESERLVSVSDERFPIFRFPPLSHITKIDPNSNTPYLIFWTFLVKDLWVAFRDNGRMTDPTHTRHFTSRFALCSGILCASMFQNRNDKFPSVVSHYKNSSDSRIP